MFHAGDQHGQVVVRDLQGHGVVGVENAGLKAIELFCGGREAVAVHRQLHAGVGAEQGDGGHIQAHQFGERNLREVTG